MKCKNCIHWKRFHKKSEGGFCKRYPPTVYYFGIRIAFNSPETHTDDYCGEFKQKEENDDYTGLKWRI